MEKSMLLEKYVECSQKADLKQEEIRNICYSLEELEQKYSDEEIDEILRKARDEMNYLRKLALSFQKEYNDLNLMIEKEIDNVINKTNYSLNLNEKEK